MDPITIDGLDEDDFRCSIEAMLREGEADAAAAKLRALIEPYAGEGRTLPARFLSVTAADLAINGWDDLDNRLGKYDRPGHWVSAIGISIVHPSEAEGLGVAAARLSPCIETSFYSDDAYPFSQSDRNDLLEGYTRQGAEWQGNFDHADMTLSISGVEDLFDAVSGLEARLLASESPAAADICAGSLAACYLSVLLHQAVRDKIHTLGLPRPLSVMAGCVGVYPFFDAPVMSSIDCLDGGFFGMSEFAIASPVARQESESETAKAEDAFGSLLNLTGRMAKKKMVMELNAEDSAAATRQFEMATAHQLAEADEAPPRTAGSNFSSFSFDTEPSALSPDDDWADIPDSPLFDPPSLDSQLNDWFAKPASDGPAANFGDVEFVFPSSDVAGWNGDEPIAEQAALEPEAAEDAWSGMEPGEEGDASFAMEEVSHPDDACRIPPPPREGHGLRAKLALNAEAEEAKKEGLLDRLRQLLSTLTRGWL